MYKLLDILNEIKIMGSKFPKNIPWYYEVKNKEDLKRVYNTLINLKYNFSDKEHDLDFNDALRLYEDYKYLTNWYGSKDDFKYSDCFWFHHDPLDDRGFKKLNEIKILGNNNITPKMVGDLYSEIGKKVKNFKDTIVPIFKKYGFFKTSLARENGGEWIWFEKLNRKQLNSLYKDLLELKDKLK